MRAAFFALAAVTLLGCPPAPTPPKWETGRPNVAVVQLATEPLVVDWQPEQRGDLEVSMKQGVAVVAFDDKGLRLLRDCKIDGTYGFFGITTKEQVVRLQTEDELRANLPTFGGVLAGKIGGELHQGGTLDVALVMVGKLRTTWHAATRADLTGGECAAATHFVRGATVGAFAMDQGTARTARVATEMFGIGASGGTSDSSGIRNRDGSLAACRESDPDSPKAPKQCGALLRIELSEIGKAGEVKQPRVAEADRCKEPLVFVDGKCATPKADVAHECTYGDGAECLEQCKKNNLESCARLAHMLLVGKGVQKSVVEGSNLATTVCEKGHARACAIAAQSSLATDPAKGVRLAKASCDRGDEQGCALYGTLLSSGIGIAKDAALAARVLAKGCNGGVESSCSELGLLFERGDGVKRDDATAAALHKRACDGDEPLGCVNYGLSLEFGSGVQKNAKAAVPFYRRACEGEPNYCIQMGAVTLAGSGVTQSTNDAVGYFEKSCGAEHPVSCAFLNGFANGKHAIDKTALKQYLSLYQAGCKADVARDCTGLGVLGVGAGMEKGDTDPIFAQACKLGDAWACTIQKLSKR